jgi:hypothetical protein
MLGVAIVDHQNVVALSQIALASSVHGLSAVWALVEEPVSACFGQGWFSAFLGSGCSYGLKFLLVQRIRGDQSRKAIVATRGFADLRENH